MICPNCGYENQERDKFCGKCGSEQALKAEIQPVPVPVVEQGTVSQQPDKPAVPSSGKKKLKIGRIVLPLLVAVCLGGGFFFGQSLIPEKNHVRRELNYDTYTLCMAAGFTYDGVTGTGTVRIIGPQGTALGQIEDVRDNSFRILDKYSKIIYLDKDGQLCEQSLPQGEKNVLAKKGIWDTVWVSEDGGYMTYSEQVDNLTETMIYDLAEGKPKRMADGIVRNQYMDVADKTLYYLDDSGTLYQYKGLSERNRIKGDVLSYIVLSSEPVVFWQSQNGEEISFGVKWGEDEERIEDFRSISDVVVSQESGMILFQGCKVDETGDSLYFYRKGQEPVEAYSDIADFYYADNLNQLYYCTDDGNLYFINLLYFTPEDQEDSERLKAAVKTLEKEKLSSDAQQMEVSKNGEHLAWITSGGELHYLYFQQDKDVVLGEQVTNMQVFDQSLYDIREDGQMNRYIFHQGEALNTKNSQNSKSGTMQISTPYGDSLAVADEETGTLQVLDRANGLITLIPDMAAYDKVIIQEELAFERLMNYNQVLGSWKLEKNEILLNLNADNTLTVYEIPDLTQPISSDGEEKIISLNPKGTNKFNLDLGAAEVITVRDDWDILTDTSSIIIGEEACYWQVGEDDEPILMEPISEGQIKTLRRNVELAMNSEAEALERSNYIAAERKQAEERRREEELRRQEEQSKRDSLLQRAKSYYNYGVYMSSGSYFYSSPNMSSRTTRYLNSGTNKTVYSYQVDYNSSIIWLKIRGSDGKNYWTYVR